MKKRLPKYALIGATGIGGYHLAAIREMEMSGLAKLVCVADPALPSNPELQAEFLSAGIRTYIDYAQLFDNEPDINVVVISAPIPFHLEMTLAFLKRDVFVYLEKPPVPLIQDLKTLISADQNKRVGVGFQMINSQWIQEMKCLVLSGKLGEVRDFRIGACWPRLESYYRRNASAGKMRYAKKPVFDGPATNALAHLIHNAMFLAGSKGEFDVPFEVTGELYRARPIDSYDTVCLRGTFRSGIRFSAALTHSTERELPYLFEVSGTKGWARVAENGYVFTDSFERTLYLNDTFEQLLTTTHRQFLEYAQGEVDRPSTSLLDTRGYVLATNGMLLSSQGISTIDGQYVRNYKIANDEGFDVVNLRDAVRESFQTGKIFSELDLPWSKSGDLQPLDNFDFLNLQELGKAELAV